MRVGKCDTIRSLNESVRLHLDKGELNHSLRLIHDFVVRIFTEPLCTSLVAGSKTLDDLCSHIGKRNLAAVKRNLEFANPQSEKPIVVYVVTKLQKSGGHTRVIEDFIKAQPWARHTVLSTELQGRSDADYFMNVLGKVAQVSFESARKQDNYQQRLTWLQIRLLEIRPSKIYLLNHHQDSVSVAAIQPEMGFETCFYHHGDHHLCLGVYLQHVDHIDPHPMGYHNCRNDLGIDNIYMPLIVEDKGERTSNSEFMHDGFLTTCTAARSNKIEIPYFVSYLEMVPELLNATGGRHIHIGRLSPWALFRIRRGLKRLGVHPNRFKYIPWVPSVWKALHEYRVDLYIASFPYGGGLTLIEAMGAGIPVVLHRHTYSRVLGGIDIAYAKAFKWRDPEQLLKICANVSVEQLRQHSQLARLQYVNFHRPQILVEILAPGGNMDTSPPGLSDEFKTQQDEFAAWIESQISLSHLVRRWIYRHALFLRNKLFG